jgi:hypothetical protein
MNLLEEPAASICRVEDFLKMKGVGSSKLLVHFSQAV